MGRTPLGSGERLRVAVIEDDDDLLRLFGELLTDAGIAVTLAASPDALPREWDGDVILTDAGAHTYDRARIADRVRCLRHRSRARIVLMSTHPEAARDTRELGVDGFLATPADIDDVVAAVRAAAGRERA